MQIPVPSASWKPDSGISLTLKGFHLWKQQLDNSNYYLNDLIRSSNSLVYHWLFILLSSYINQILIIDYDSWSFIVIEFVIRKYWLKAYKSYWMRIIEMPAQWSSRVLHSDAILSEKRKKKNTFQWINILNIIFSQA